MKKMMLLALGCVALVGCGTVVPPGKKVILLHPSGDTEIIDKGVYKSWGRTREYFVDQKLASFKEEMQILCSDDINMSVDIKCLLSFDVSGGNMDFIKNKVPAVPSEDGGQELSLDKFYEMAVKDIVRGSARNVVSVQSTDDIRPNRQILEKELGILVQKRVAELKYPVKISAVLISNIDYPESVKEMREKIKRAQLSDQEKAAESEAQLSQAQREVAIEQERAKVRMVKAQAQADENRILSESLTPAFLTWRQMEVLENVGSQLANGPSNTVLMMPYKALNQELTNTALLKSSIDDIKEVPKTKK